MGKLSDAKSIGATGSVLLLLGFAPYAGPVLAIAGFVLVLVALKYVSDAVGDRTIFNNGITAIGLTTVGLAVAAFFAFTGMSSFIVFTTIASFIFFGGFAGSTLSETGLTLVGAVLIWVLYLVGAIFLRRTYESIKTRLGVALFGIVGPIYMIGAGLVIVFIGFIILLVAGILQIIAFFMLPDQPPGTQVVPPPSAIPSPP